MTKNTSSCIAHTSTCAGFVKAQTQYSTLMSEGNISNGRPSRSGRASRGFLSLEAGLVLLVVAIMIVAAVIYYRDNLRKTSVNTNISHLLATASAGRSTFGQTNQYANVSTAVAVSSNMIPPALRDGTAQTATNTFGGAINVEPATLSGASPDALKITWPNVPSNQCIDIVMGIFGEARQVQVAGSDVKPLDGQINLANTTSQCASADNVTLDMFVGRN